MKIKAADLTDDALDWAVAKALADGSEAKWLKDRKTGYLPSFSRNWEYGGPLLAQCVENGMLIEGVDPQYKTLPKFKVTLDRWESVPFRADSLLVAVCRCYVAFKLGPDVDVPQEVLDLPAVA